MTMDPSKFVQLCPNWPLHGVVSKGHWTNGIAEFFGKTEDGPTTHVHWYCSPAKAEKVFTELPEETQRKIEGMQSISFKIKRVWEPGECISDRPDGYYIFDQSIGYWELMGREEALWQAGNDPDCKVYEIFLGEEIEVHLFAPGEEAKQLKLF